MNFAEWFKILKEFYAKYLFLTYFVLAAIFYPYLLSIGIAPKINFTVIASILFLLLPIAVAFLLIFPIFMFACNELLREFFWKKIKVFYNVNNLDKKMLSKGINELAKEELELLSKLKLNVDDKTCGGNLDKYFFLPFNLAIQGLLGVVLFYLMISSGNKTNPGDIVGVFLLLILQIGIFFWGVNRIKNKNALKENFDLTIFPAFLVCFVFSIGLFEITGKLLEMKLAGYEFWFVAKYTINWFLCYIALRCFISPNIAIKLNLVDRLKVCSILGVLPVACISVANLNIKGSLKEKESPFIYTISKPAMKALQVLNRGAIERPIIINKEMCLKYKELILDDNQSCEERNCFIGNILLDLDNRYVKTDKGFILELDSTNSTIINNEFYKEMLNSNQRDFCISFDVGLNK